MRSVKASPLGVLAGALLCSAALLAQNSTIAPRITSYVDESSLTTLKGNVPRLARAEYDQGEADSSTQLTHIRLVLSRTSEQQAALDQYLAQLQDKSSPNYHKWLTPQQFGQLYGPADSDVAALVAWLESHGLTLETVSTGRTNIAFSGSVSQVEEAFHTSIHSFQAGDRQFTSNITDPQIPSALTGVVMGVARLNTIRPRPHSERGTAGKFNPPARRREPADALSANGPGPGLTDTTGGYFLYIVPADAATIYDTPNPLNSAFSGTACGSSAGCTGAGVNIGVGGDATITASIVGTYRSAFLGSSTTPTLKYCTTSSSCSATPSGSGWVASDSGEAYIDTELSGGLAPGATIYYYASTDLVTGIEAALDANVVDIFSLSFGYCESDNGAGTNALINGWWQQAAGQGIAVTVSSGDTGSASCDGDRSGTIRTAIYGLSVSGYASTPYNIAVGGTDFYGLENSFSTYVNETLGTAGSPTYYRTAKSLIPESVWNDSVQNDTNFLAENVPWTGTSANIIAGSGGASSCATGSGATCAGYSKPSWQTGTGVPADGVRDIPDVSLMAGNGADSATWLICDNSSGKNFGGSTVTLNCSNIAAGDFDGYGGTSTAAPAFAGILALVQQSDTSKSGCTWVNCKRLGQAAQELYALYNGSHAGAIFRDVTVGNNSVPCTSGTTNCALNTAGNYYLSGYDTKTGYDLASGLGSVDATQLVNYWSSSTGTSAATVNVTPPTPNPVTTVESLSVPVSVTGGSGTPTGTVTLTSGSYNSGAQTLASGSYTFTVPAGSLAVGLDTLTVTYSGDSTYASKTNSSTTVTVTESTFSLAATSPSGSIAPGGSATSTVTVTAVNGYTGTVTPTCVLTTPTNLTDPPSCSIPSTAVAMGGTATATVYTTAASAALLYPKLPGKSRGLFGAGGGAVLALLLFLGIPARRRSWRSMLGILVVMAALGSLAACGGGGGSSSTGPPPNPGTAAGTYTFTVTGTGNPTVTPAPTTTFTVTVN